MLKAAQPVRLCRCHSGCSRYTATSDADLHRHLLCSATLCMCFVVSLQCSSSCGSVPGSSFLCCCCNVTNLLSWCFSSHLLHQSLSPDADHCCKLEKASLPCFLYRRVSALVRVSVQGLNPWQGFLISQGVSPRQGFLYRRVSALVRGFLYRRVSALVRGSCAVLHTDKASLSSSSSLAFAFVRGF